MKVLKRDGRRVEFDAAKIEGALYRCLSEAMDRTTAEERMVMASAVAINGLPDADLVTIEEVQQAAIRALIDIGDPLAAVRYAEYKGRHDAMRGRDIPPAIRSAYESNEKWFSTQLQQFQILDKYARWNPEEGRREVWAESIDRVVNQFGAIVRDRGSQVAKVEDRVRLHGMWETIQEPLRASMLHMKAMCSMRMLAMAGPAFQRNNASAYNCTYSGIDDPYSIVEMLVLLMCGCGCGFSVESQFIDQLPPIGTYDGRVLTEEDLWIWGETGLEHFARSIQTEKGRRVTHVVEDSSEGWADAVATGLSYWWNGADIDFDYSKVRPSGTKLRTKGGSASGPEPLRRLLDHCRRILLNARGRQLISVEVYDLVCIVADCVVCGGVRRSALLCMFDWDDMGMRNAKAGMWWKVGHADYAPWRQNSNNSMVPPHDRELTYCEVGSFLTDMSDSGMGEPGLVSRRAALLTMPDRRRDAMRGTGLLAKMGFNPCVEILLRHMGFCNLSIAVARPGDTFEDLQEKVTMATILGTLQACATNFRGLRQGWKVNAEDERLLGVDITGQRDRPISAEDLSELREVVREVNAVWADALGIKRGAALTCNKPSGNSSVAFDCSPGINPRWSMYQIRNVEVLTSTPMFKVLRDAGVPMVTKEISDTLETATTVKVCFPSRAPAGTKFTTQNTTALDQLAIWKRNKIHWCEHNPSTSITFQKKELPDIVDWLHTNQDIASGLAFFPAVEGDIIPELQPRLPNIVLTKREYEEHVDAFPPIDFSRLYLYETDDETTAATELACSGGICSI